MSGEQKQTPWKMPPLVKVYEALGALADRRVERADDGSWRVASSMGDKRYTVEVGADGREIAANDNASYWQGYLGYPAVAVLLARGLRACEPSALEALKGIPWKEINRRNRNDWERTVADVERIASERGNDATALRRTTESILDAIRVLAPYRGRRLRPPSSGSEG